MKITNTTKVCDVLHEAAKTAKGRNTLYESGERCLWGEAAHLCGVQDADLEGFGMFGFGASDEVEMDGMQEWDSELRDEAVSLACKDENAGKTVADFRDFLRRCRYPLIGLDKVTA